MVRGRNRAAAIIIAQKHILLIKRNRPGFGRYYVFPGGGVEGGEDPRAAVKRELREETGLKVKIGQEAFFGFVPSGARHTYFLAQASFLPVALPKQAEENHPARIKIRGTTEPVWVSLRAFRRLRVLPEVVHQMMLTALRQGFSKHPVEVGELWSGSRKKHSR